MKNELFQFSDQVLKQIKCLRRISPTDKFPCFSCFDDKYEKLNCHTCQGRGYITGSHPMVQFTQDFIQKKIQHLQHPQQQYLKQSIKQAQLHTTFNPMPIPTSAIMQNKSNTSCQSKQLSSQHGQQEDIIHNGYNCNQCKQDPIRGCRYHCKQCQDYDLCGKCFRDTYHKHQFNKFQTPQYRNSFNIINLSKQNIKSTVLRKTIKRL